jgi:hypothetical protein
LMMNGFASNRITHAARVKIQSRAPSFMTDCFHRKAIARYRPASALRPPRRQKPAQILSPCLVRPPAPPRPLERLGRGSGSALAGRRRGRRPGRPRQRGRIGSRILFSRRPLNNADVTLKELIKCQSLYYSPHLSWGRRR